MYLYISVLGDWNSDISDHASIFCRQLMTFCADNNMILSSKSHLPIDTFTHYSEAWRTTSWLDHIISTCDADAIINNNTTDYNVSTADHLPVCIDIAFQRVPEVETVNDINHHRIAWDKINQAGKNEYSTVTET